MKKTDMNVILGGDPFSNVFRATYDLNRFWKLTDPDYCLSVMEQAYNGGCRCFEVSFPEVQDIYLKLEKWTDDKITGIANPTYLQGVELYGKPLQFMRDRILSSISSGKGLLSEVDKSLIREELSGSVPMVFGFDHDAPSLSDREISDIFLNEDRFIKRLKELDACSAVVIGGTDADWLFSLGRQDIIIRMSEIVRSLGKTPYLICHYASVVIPAADEAGLDVEGYFVPVNMEWAWTDREKAVAAIKESNRPVTAFMAFAHGDLRDNISQAAEWLRDECGVSGIMYGTTVGQNAYNTARMLCDLFNS